MLRAGRFQTFLSSHSAQDLIGGFGAEEGGQDLFVVPIQGGGLERHPSNNMSRNRYLPFSLQDLNLNLR